MFSGIIEAVGTVAALEHRGEGARLAVDGGLDPSSLTLGESICTSGVCLTVRERTATGFVADLSGETLRRTTLGALRTGDRVNLERSLRIGDRVSGHFVFGHVDGVGRVKTFDPAGDGFSLRVEAGRELAPFLVDKGSIAVDGVSLTMCDVDDTSFGVAVIPHTYEVTTLSVRHVGDPVNLEADMLARYARRVLEIVRTPD
ncbi:MAG: riboflavin synthase [Thermodesulfobacteriota bacterium]